MKVTDKTETLTEDTQLKTEDTQLQTANTIAVADTSADDIGTATGFEDANADDTIIPRIKIINALSPERVEGEAEEGDIINSLTKQSVVGKRFIPIKIFYSNIEFNPDRDDETNRIFCRSFDGKTAESSEGECRTCSICRRNQFDNTKTGKDAQPKCTAFMNFLGFFEGDPLPVVVSFSKTSYNEGKKMLSIGKSMRKSIWSYAYTFEGKQLVKGKQKWYVIAATLNSPTTAEEQLLATEIFKAYHAAVVNTSYDDDAVNTTQTNAETEAEI